MLTAILILCICNAIADVFIFLALFYFLSKGKDSPKKAEKNIDNAEKERIKREAEQKAIWWQNFFSYTGESQMNNRNKGRD